MLEVFLLSYIPRPLKYLLLSSQTGFYKVSLAAFELVILLFPFEYLGLQVCVQGLEVPFKGSSVLT